MNLEEIKKEALVFDIETSAHYPSGQEINIMIDFDSYVEYAICKWVGCYSYKYNKGYWLNVYEDRDLIISLFEDHDILVGFNSEEFDFPILKNNGLIVDTSKYYTQVDCMKILGASSFKDKKGFKFKGRGELMDYKFKNNKLKTVAEVMKLEVQKGDIDYKIFAKRSWSPEEKAEIIKYLKGDVLATKGMFDKLWDYWKPFTELLDFKSIKNLTWIRSSIASLIYKSACFIMKTEATYADGGGQQKEQMGGRVIEPKYEEANDVWYIDFASLYPHIFCMFNLFDETTEKDGRNVWHGNDVFQVKGYYNISEPHILSKAVQEKLVQRTLLKKNDPKNPMIYTIKIWLNGLYGIIRSAIFEKVHNENGGWDCCWLGQQIQKLTEDMMDRFGFETIGGDTDSLKVKAIDPKNSNREYVSECLEKIVAKILHNVPFPVKTYNIDIENYLTYIMYPFSDQHLIDEDTKKKLAKGNCEGYLKTEQDGKQIIIDEATEETIKVGRKWVAKRKGKKKNYMYIYEKNGERKIKLVGLPIMKDNATKLGIKIYEEILKPKILKSGRAKFPKKLIDDQMTEYLQNKEIMNLLSREFKIKPFDSYKIPLGKTEPTGIYAQISRGYFNGQDGIIHLIKNNKIGKAGKGSKYCTVEEAIEAGLTVEDLDLEKVWNELDPFILFDKDLTKP